MVVSGRSSARAENKPLPAAPASTTWESIRPSEAFAIIDYTGLLWYYFVTGHITMSMCLIMFRFVVYIKIYLFMLFKKSKMFRECDQKNGSSANSQSTSALDETDPLISTEFLMLFALSGLHFKGTFSCSAVREYTFVCIYGMQLYGSSSVWRPTLY